jgi:hypothetical protein
MTNFVRLKTEGEGVETEPPTYYIVLSYQEMGDF